MQWQRKNFSSEKPIIIKGEEFEHKGYAEIDKSFTKYTVDGFVNGNSATLSGEFEKPIEKADDIYNNLGYDYVLDVNMDTVSTCEEIAKILDVNANKAFRLVNDGCLPQPKFERKTKGKTFRQWDFDDIVNMKPYVHMTKMDLLGVIARNLQNIKS